VLEEFTELSPVVQAVHPSAAFVGLKGALRYHGPDSGRLGKVLRIRALSRLGIDAESETPRAPGPASYRP
jgi:DNA polymerase-4